MIAVQFEHTVRADARGGAGLPAAADSDCPWWTFVRQVIPAIGAESGQFARYPLCDRNGTLKGETTWPHEQPQ